MAPYDPGEGDGGISLGELAAAIVAALPSPAGLDPAHRATPTGAPLPADEAHLTQG